MHSRDARVAESESNLRLNQLLRLMAGAEEFADYCHELIRSVERRISEFGSVERKQINGVFGSCKQLICSFTNCDELAGQFEHVGHLSILK